MSGETIQVRVFGSSFPVRISGDAARAQAVATEVDERMREIARSAGSASTSAIAILAALNFANELDGVRVDAGEGASEIETRISDLNDRLRAAIEQAEAVLASGGK